MNTQSDSLSRVIIVGGGTAGWISAALLVRLLGRVLNITLIESEAIGTVGVGEATIPPILTLNAALNVDEADFIQATKATIKLGIQFENWKTQGHSYMHAFGGIGKDFPFCAFHHFWTRGQQQGQASDLWDYSLNYQAAKQNKFAKLERLENANLQGLVYAYHFDAGLYAAYLRKYSEDKGVKRIEGLIEQCNLNPENGFIQSVTLNSGETIEGDLFIDCSGFRGLLIEQTLGAGYEDWSHWLPCDRAVAVQCSSAGPVTPYTRSIAHDAGWQWRIPLQHRIGNGLVYCSKYLSEDEASASLLNKLDGKPLTEPRAIPFKTGRRRLAWHRNCVAVGLSSGFLEPLESTSIHLIQSAIIRLIKHYPHQGIKLAEVDEYNVQTREEFEHVRDFIILHYHLNQRDDSQFWRECQGMDIPESLRHKMTLFKTAGKLFTPHEALFSDIAWQQVMIGQGLIPEDYHPLADALTEQQLADLFSNLAGLMRNEAAKLPNHDDYLRSHFGVQA